MRIFSFLGDLPSQKPSKLGENQLYPTYKLKNIPAINGTFDLRKAAT